METYTLIVLVALFLGVMGIIAMMERRRRTELAQFEQLQQTLSACVGTLQSIHSSAEAQTAQVAAALSQLEGTIQAGTKTTSESTQKLSGETDRAIERVATKLTGVTQANTKELIERLEWFSG